MRYEVKTKYNGSQIDQTLLMHDDLCSTVEQVWRKVIDLEEEGVRGALIALGWTPPAGENAQKGG